MPDEKAPDGGLFWRAPAPADLAALVISFMARRDSAPREIMTIFPNAQPELFFHFGSDYLTSRRVGAPLEPLPLGALLAPRVERYEHVCGPKVDWFLVQLTPEGCRRLLGAPMHALIDVDRPLADFSKSAGLLHEQLAARPTFCERMTTAIQWMRSERQKNRAGDDAVSQAALRARRTPISRVGILAAQLDVGERRLHQRFVEEIGIPPKHWLSLMRAERLWFSLHPNAFNHGAVLAEYADESHAHREFLRFTGMTMSEYKVAKADGDGLVNGANRKQI